ncbi:IS3 family transposase [Paenibacillus tritici]|uniref:IS3 family transposase n=1 Tax=Paenibacillus tritici TaxID=1873425 RepID=UPI001BA876AE|nr:IS3 family transposase [Paenibacillus tritici]
MCIVFQVSRSGYYKWRTAKPTPQAILKALLLKRIAYHFDASQGRYGSPKITILLEREGYKISERTIGKYMRELGLRSCNAKRAPQSTKKGQHNGKEEH